MNGTPVMYYLLLVVGFAFLIKGADIFVEGSGGIARALKVPSLIIGLTIVSIGTSAPEASVSILASLSNNSEIALSNILGSNIFNLMLVVGISAVLMPAQTDSDLIKRDFPAATISSVMVLIFCLDGEIQRIEGILLLLCMIIYFILIIKSAFKSKYLYKEAEGEKAPSTSKNILFIVIGLGAIIFGGNLVVKNAVSIALDLGLSQTLVGVTIVAIGTSLPELATSVAAAKKGDSGLALGNAVGSNIFNVFFILGASAALSPIKVIPQSICDAWIFVATTVIMFVFCFTGKKTNRTEGIICLLIYAAYTFYVIYR